MMAKRQLFNRLPVPVPTRTCNLTDAREFCRKNFQTNFSFRFHRNKILPRGGNHNDKNKKRCYDLRNKSRRDLQLFKRLLFDLSFVIEVW